jgi:hypothetical protein
MSTTSHLPTDPYRRGTVFSRSFLPLVLITIGVVFLLGNLIPDRARGGLIVFGLGVAFMVGRLTTGRYGYAVPAGILMAIGAHIGLQELGLLQGSSGPGPFFAMLGLGFVLIYIIGGRPSAIWPLFPGLILLCLGLVVFGARTLAPLAAFSGIVAFWPVALVLFGVWLIFRDNLPTALRRPVATIGGLALAGYCLLAAGATIASGSAAVARPPFVWSFGPSPLTDTVHPEGNLSAGQTLTVNSGNGQIAVHQATDNRLHVAATRHYGVGGQPPDVSLRQTSSGATLDSAGSNPRFPLFGFGSPNWVDYSIEVPAGVTLDLESGSGSVDVDGTTGNVQARVGSGQLRLINIVGDVQANTGSGTIDLGGISGAVRAEAGSGEIRGSDVKRVQEVSTGSGAISLAGTFKEAASVRASSGSVDLKLKPDSAVLVNVKTGSGDISVDNNVPIQNLVKQPHSLTGTVGSPASNDARLSVETSSGSVTLSQ